LQCHLDHGVGK